MGHPPPQPNTRGGWPQDEGLKLGDGWDKMGGKVKEDEYALPWGQAKDCRTN